MCGLTDSFRFTGITAEMHAATTVKKTKAVAILP